MVEVDPHIPFPEEQVPFFVHHDPDAKRARKRGLQLLGLLDLDDPVATLTLPEEVRSIVGDELRRGAFLLSQLQATS
jgi:hypothetical protein